MPQQKFPGMQRKYRFPSAKASAIAKFQGKLIDPTLK